MRVQSRKPKPREIGLGNYNHTFFFFFFLRPKPHGRTDLANVKILGDGITQGAGDSGNDYRQSKQVLIEALRCAGNDEREISESIVWEVRLPY